MKYTVPPTKSFSARAKNYRLLTGRNKEVVVVFVAAADVASAHSAQLLANIQDACIEVKQIYLRN